MSKTSDPRDSSLEKKVRFPRSWGRESLDALGTSGMFMAGLIMVTKNRYLSWPALLLALNGVINQHPLRSKETGTSPWGTLLLAIAAVFVSYSPLFLVTPQVVPQSTPLS